MGHVSACHPRHPANTSRDHDTYLRKGPVGVGEAMLSNDAVPSHIYTEALPQCVCLEVAGSHRQLLFDVAFEVLGWDPQSSMYLQIGAVVQIYASHWRPSDSGLQCQVLDSSAPLRVLFQVVQSVDVEALHFAVLSPAMLLLECTQASWGHSHHHRPASSMGFLRQVSLS